VQAFIIILLYNHQDHLGFNATSRILLQYLHAVSLRLLGCIYGTLERQKSLGALFMALLGSN
jgi:hypothetical protein